MRPAAGECFIFFFNSLRIVSSGAIWRFLVRKISTPPFEFDTGIVTDAYMIILLRTLEIDDQELIKGGSLDDEGLEYDF